MIEFEKTLGGTKILQEGNHIGWLLVAPNRKWGLEFIADKGYFPTYDSEEAAKKAVGEAYGTLCTMRDAETK